MLDGLPKISRFKSLPARERGLKLSVEQMTEVAFRRSPRGSVD